MCVQVCLCVFASVILSGNKGFCVLLSALSTFMKSVAGCVYLHYLSLAMYFICQDLSVK